MFENMRHITFFAWFLNSSFKMTISFANVARTIASTSILKAKVANHQELGLYMKNSF